MTFRRFRPRSPSLRTELISLFSWHPCVRSTATSWVRLLSQIHANLGSWIWFWPCTTLVMLKLFTHFFQVAPCHISKNVCLGSHSVSSWSPHCSLQHERPCLMVVSRPVCVCRLASFLLPSFLTHKQRLFRMCLRWFLSIGSFLTLSCAFSTSASRRANLLTTHNVC